RDAAVGHLQWPQHRAHRRRYSVLAAASDRRRNRRGCTDEITRHIMVGAKPYGQLQYQNVNGKRMAYVDEGQGDAIVFAHGNPTSSYLWRNVMPHLDGLGRLVACDLIGMGGSDKLHPSGPGRYHYAEQRDYLFALWEALDLGDNVTLVLHDWGSVLGFDW